MNEKIEELVYRIYINNISLLTNKIMELKTIKNIDIDKLNNLFASVWWHAREEERWNRVFEVSRYVVSAWDWDELIWFWRILEDSDFAFFLDVLVDKDYQSKSVWKAIVQKLIDFTKDKKYFQISLYAWIEWWSEKLFNFYWNLGFERVVNWMELVKYQYRP